jgi:hypothetical protein
MPSGILGRNDLAATSNTSVYTVPSSKLSVLNFTVSNRGTSTAFLRVALSDSGTPAQADFIEYDSALIPGGVLERTGLVMDASKVLVAYSSNANVSIVAYGYEENV